MSAAADREDGADSRYSDWLAAYNEDRHRGGVPGVDAAVRLGGRTGGGFRGSPARPDVSTRRRPRYARKSHVR